MNGSGDSYQRSTDHTWMMPLMTGSAVGYLVITAILVVAAFFAGTYAGFFVSGIGTYYESGLADIILRGLLCAVPGALLALALALPRYWVVPWLVYCFFFHASYTFEFSFGQTHGYSHPELIWIYIISLWAVSFCTMVRRYVWRRIAKA